MEMDEKKLGEAIGNGMGEASAKMMPQMTEAMVVGIRGAQTGLFVDVPASEMAEGLRARAKLFREMASEFESRPPPPPPGYAGCETLTAAEKTRYDGTIKTTLTVIRSTAERYDFLAKHVVPDVTYRLDPREVDALFFDTSICTSLMGGSLIGRY